MKCDISNLTIMELDKEKLQEVSELVSKVFLEFEGPNESQEGIKNFKEFVKEESLKEKYESKIMRFVGCFDKNRLVGLISTRDGNHISLLFVDKEYQKRGIANELLKNIILKCEGEYEYISVNSSIYAVNIYHKFGFVDKKDKQEEDGIRFVPMQLQIRSD